MASVLIMAEGRQEDNPMRVSMPIDSPTTHHHPLIAAVLLVVVVSFCN